MPKKGKSKKKKTSIIDEYETPEEVSPSQTSPMGTGRQTTLNFKGKTNELPTPTKLDFNENKDGPEQIQAPA